MYVATENGINVRASEDINSTIVATLRYGEAVTILESENKPIEIDGFHAHWVQVNNDNGANGYIVDAYLSPLPPPNIFSDNFETYPQQFTARIINTINLAVPESDDPTRDYKMIFDNGITTTHLKRGQHESVTLSIPNIDLETAYVLIKNISQCAVVYPTDGKMPVTSTTEDHSSSHNGIKTINVTKNEQGEVIHLVMSHEIEQEISLTFTQLPGEVTISYEISL